jgi:hypothetical protein
MAEAAVGVAVGMQRLEDGCHRRAVQEHSQAVPVQQPGVGINKLLTCVDVDWHAATLRRG